MREFHILNLGAGVQSTCLYLMAMEGDLPRFNAAIFADTGEEPVDVYKHLEWLQTLGGPPILVRTRGKLGDDLIRNDTGGRVATIPAFTSDDDGNGGGQVRRQCSSEYKIEVIERTIKRELIGMRPRQRMPKDVVIQQYFGISFDEVSRATRIWERYHLEHSSIGIPHFPLVDRQMSRANCLDWLAGRVPHIVPRSACTFCPFHSDLEWTKLKTAGGADWARIIEIDRGLRLPGAIAQRGLRCDGLYLHRDRRPIDEVVFRPHANAKEMQLGFGIECEGVCGV
jgi:hypothetical protein